LIAVPNSTNIKTSRPRTLILIDAQLSSRLSRYTRHGQNERELAVGRKNYLFMGSEAGGKSAAIAYTLMETDKMNKVNPEAWLAWVLERIQDHPANRMGDLMPWAYQNMIDAAELDVEATIAA